MTPLFRPLNLICCCIGLLLSIAASADTLTIREQQLNGSHIPLLPYFKAWEDPGRQSDTTQILQRSQSFQPVSELQPQSRTSFYWLSLDIRNETGSSQDLVLAFNNLTYVDLYLYQNGQFLSHGPPVISEKKTHQ